MHSEKYAVAMMRRRGAGGRRISTWASPFEWHAGMAIPKCLKPTTFFLELQLKKKKLHSLFYIFFRSNFPMNDWQFLFLESIENLKSQVAWSLQSFFIRLSISNLSNNQRRRMGISSRAATVLFRVFFFFNLLVFVFFWAFV